MLTTLVNLAIAILIVGLVVGLFVWAVRQATIIPDPFRQIAIVLVVVAACLLLLGVATGHLGGGFHFVTIR